MKLVLVIAVAGVPAAWADPVEEVRHAEITFAKAFADRDKARFFDMILEDATFFGRQRTLTGKKAVVDQWSKFFEGSAAPFSWAPERVMVNAAGTTGWSTGPVFGADGRHSGSFATVWVRQKDGSWKVLFDAGGPSPANLAEDAIATEEGFVPADDGVKLHYRKVGSGPVTVIAPLGFVLHDDFKSLAEMATVITYDMRNRGRSDRVSDVTTLTIEQDVKDLEAVRRHLKVESFVPIGYSYLGMVAALYAIDHPGRVNRIIQLGPVPMTFGTEYPKHLTNDYADVAVPEADLRKWQEMRAGGMAEKSPREFCEIEAKVIPYVLIGNPANVSRVKTHCDLENEWPVNFARHLKYNFESVKKVQLNAEALKKLAVPVLTIHGTKDRNAPYGAGREWAMSLPNGRLVTIEGGGHQSWSDDPATVFAAIREFLRGNWPLGAEKVSKLDPLS